MIIKAKLLPAPIIKATAYFLTWIFRKRFNKMVINEIGIKKQHSYLLMCNHFSFWDGFWAAYLCLHAIHKKQEMTGFYIMVLKKQMQMNPWLRYFGCFSVAPGTSTVNESLSYAAELLSKPGNLVLIFPQGNLESNHVRDIVMKDGINQIVPQIKGDCQLIWSSNFIEYFESLKPSVYFNMLDCGTNHHFNFEDTKSKINSHHKAAMKKQFRFTDD
ncbi:1-acyl-sn-glycerol-3-phosphate acyltransferase [Pedobacter sp. SD-b]|uniref:1-acyl-sn-glycerol-3-phosphate acyltransferase n=1 Tax=Pedobacter segetis TaxID=2793069 RepID=A0ABS1BK08_9SPHI|nr:1-acyl-sn-glycerol-3-phosphate acyltransferase [Pedobacter segetis]MBK0383212.1 1-acyl-sn-glycerol-3-phosphate acyltransferase [Pedobacter segetis]